MLAGDALQRCIPADGAMGAHQLTEGHQARVETRFTLAATPWIHTNHAKRIIYGVLATRTTGVLTFADWANHLTACIPLYKSGSKG